MLTRRDFLKMLGGMAALVAVPPGLRLGQVADPLPIIQEQPADSVTLNGKNIIQMRLSQRLFRNPESWWDWGNPELVAEFHENPEWELDIDTIEPLDTSGLGPAKIDFAMKGYRLQGEGHLNQYTLQSGGPCSYSFSGKGKLMLSVVP